SAAGPRLGGRDPDPRPRHGAAPRRLPPDARDGRPGGRYPVRRDLTDRGCSVHGRVPPGGRGAGPPSTHPRGRWLVTIQVAGVPVAGADQILTPEALRFVERLARAFEPRRRALLAARAERRAAL